MEWAIWVGLAAVVVVSLLVQHLSGPPNRDQRAAGTGRYARYGPNASDERIAELDYAYGNYKSGVAPFIRGMGPRGNYLERRKADLAWRESADHGCREAHTALGISAYIDHDPNAASDFWRKAASASHDPARILLDLVRDAAPPVSASAFITAFLHYENPEGGFGSALKHESGALLVRVAVSLGYDEYAKDVAHALRINPSGYTI